MDRGAGQPVSVWCLCCVECGAGQPVSVWCLWRVECGQGDVRVRQSGTPHLTPPPTIHTLRPRGCVSLARRYTVSVQEPVVNDTIMVRRCPVTLMCAECDKLHIPPPLPSLRCRRFGRACA